MLMKPNSSSGSCPVNPTLLVLFTLAGVANAHAWRRWPNGSYFALSERPQSPTTASGEPRTSGWELERCSAIAPAGVSSSAIRPITPAGPSRLNTCSLDADVMCRSYSPPMYVVSSTLAPAVATRLVVRRCVRSYVYETDSRPSEMFFGRPNSFQSIVAPPLIRRPALSYWNSTELPPISVNSLGAQGPALGDVADGPDCTVAVRPSPSSKLTDFKLPSSSYPCSCIDRRQFW